MNNLCFYCKSGNNGRCDYFPHFSCPTGQRVYSCELFSPESLKVCDIVFRDYKTGFYIGTVSPTTFNRTRKKNQINHETEIS